MLKSDVYTYQDDKSNNKFFMCEIIYKESCGGLPYKICSSHLYHIAIVIPSVTDTTKKFYPYGTTALIRNYNSCVHL
nr:hypothetical protein PBILCG01_0041900 [Plasmodium sp. DRC-Itaito]